LLAWGYPTTPPVLGNFDVDVIETADSLAGDAVVVVNIVLFIVLFVLLSSMWWIGGGRE
jgi:hypothetical protein